MDATTVADPAEAIATNRGDRAAGSGNGTAHPAAGPAAAPPLYGSFLLGGTEFALPASAIREVVNFPARMTPVPLAPPYLAGMFTLRGAVIPVVHLARLFDAAAPAPQPEDKVAIVLHQDVLIGILFDATGEVLRVKPEQLSLLDYWANDGGGDLPGPQVVAGTILLDGGARLIQVLNPAHLVRIENVPQVVAQTATRVAQAALAAGGRLQGGQRRAIAFRAGGSRFALDIAAVQEIIRVPDMQGSVLNSPICLGRFNFRGMPVAAVDFAALLGAQGDGGPERRVVVVRIAGAVVGLLVDAIDTIVAFKPDDLMPIPLLGKARAAMFAGCLARPGEDDIIMLDHDAMLANSEIQAMHQGHAALFRDQQAAQAAHGAHVSKRAQRKVYLLFHVHERYAVEIRQIREIMEFDGNLARAPGMPLHLRGILNVRRQMVSLVDLHRLYGLPAIAADDAGGHGKVLIVDRDGAEPVGLLVDTIDSIVTVDDSHRYATPSLMRGANRAGLQAESSEVLEVPAPNGGTQSVCLLDCRALVARLESQPPA